TSAEAPHCCAKAENELVLWIPGGPQREYACRPTVEFMFPALYGKADRGCPRVAPMYRQGLSRQPQVERMASVVHGHVQAIHFGRQGGVETQHIALGLDTRRTSLHKIHRTRHGAQVNAFCSGAL